MATAVLIGRKELFAFADRYSSRRLRDYSELADGEVLCRLFSLVFPQLAIRPASAQTHSQTQRTLINWEALFRGCARVHIPLSLLDPVALAKNDTEQGFSTLVLFYFLYHLSKKTDFSAEFAMDVSLELTSFLQSIDSIASLLLGEAVDWEAIPEELGDIIRQQPSFHVSPQDQEALEDAAAKRCRAMLSPPPAAPAAASTNTSASGKTKAGQRRGHRLVPPQPAQRKTTPSAVEESFAVSSLSSPDRKEMPLPEPSLHSFSRAGTSRFSREPSEVEEAASTCSTRDSRPLREPRLGTIPTPAPQENHAFTNGAAVSSPPTSHVRDSPHQEDQQQFRRRYVEKAKEVETLRGSNIQLLARVASLQAELEYTRSQASDAERRAEEMASAVQSLTHELEASHAQLQALAKDKREESTKASEKIRGLYTPPPEATTDAVASPTGEEDNGEENDDADVAETIDALLEDVVDPNTGDSLDAHQLANLLHCALLEHMQDAPINRGRAQSWLWSIVTAYHVLETRLVSAVDVIEALEKRLAKTHAARPTKTTGDSPSQSDAVQPSQWAEWHDVEHRLRRLCAEKEAALHSLATSAGAREDLWRRLCASLHEAERLSSAALSLVAESNDEAELDRVLSDRENSYHQIEEFTEALRGTTLALQANHPTPALIEACTAVQRMAEAAITEKAALVRRVSELQTQLEKVQRGAASALQTTGTSHSPKHPLSAPPPLSELVGASSAPSSRHRSSEGGNGAASAVRTRPKVVEPSARTSTSNSPLGPTSSPYGKNLAALLAEATSPYDELAAH